MDEIQDDTHEMIERALAGDRAAAAWLYDTFAADLYRRLRQRYAYAGGPDAEDLLHDAYAFYFQRDGKVLRDFLERVRPGDGSREALARHLWDLACGVASNRRRSAWLRRVLPVAEVRAEAPSVGAERSAVARDLLVKLDACLRASGERLYLYYQLRFRDGLTPAEVSEVAGWSTKATYKLKETLNKALARCSELLGLSAG